MNTRLGNNLYRAGLVGAAVSILYTIDVIWVHESGSSLLPIYGPGRFVSREDMLATVAIGIASTLLLWGAGAAGRHFASKSAETRAAAEKAGAADARNRSRQRTDKLNDPPR